MPDPEHVLVGRVVRPHGIRGEVAVEVTSDRPGRLAPGATVHGEGRALVVAASRPHKGRLLVRFEGVEDRTAAEGLRGLELTARPPEGEVADTYLVQELVGLPVLEESGHPVGTVQALIELPPAAGYDLLEVVREDGSTWLLPATEDYVDTGVEGGRVTHLRLNGAPDGLVEGDGW